MRSEKLSRNILTFNIIIMELNELKEIVWWLAKSQNYYYRIKRSLDLNDTWEELLKVCNEENIKNWVDFVIFTES